jgi:hypothetical protein
LKSDEQFARARDKQTGWSRHFDDPIPTGDGGELRSIRDAGVYILALPPPQAEREHRKAAMDGFDPGRRARRPDDVGADRRAAGIEP